MARAFLVALMTIAAIPALAAERYALVITGASGGEEYASKYQGWRTSFVRTLREKFAYPEDHVKVLSEEGGRGQQSTREDVRAALSDLRRRAVDGDISIVLLLGHGTADSDDAKFNLVGPDLTVDEWAALVGPIPGRVVFINASSGSYPFLAKLAGRGRIVLTAGDNAA
jgi:Caspase domain